MAQLVDPERRLHTFYEALLDLENKRRRKARVLFFGTSEIGDDRVTSQLRRGLQERFGDGGKGWVLVDRTWAILDHRDVQWRHDEHNWRSYSTRLAKLESGHYGLGGVLVESVGPAWADYQTVGEEYGIEEGYPSFAAGTAWSRIELHYQSHPQGTPLTVDIDNGAVRKVVLTLSNEIRDEVFAARVPDGPHRLRVDAPAAGVRMYGVTLERDEGLVLDALMVIGAWAHSMTPYDPAHLKAQIDRRQPVLLIFQLGAKEALRYPELSPQQVKQFAESYSRSVHMAMAGREDMACLIISPKDQGWMRGGRIETRPAVPKLVATAEQVAAETGCAFYNLYEAMGGEGTARRWYHQTPRLISSDYGHLEDAGSLRVGEMLGDLFLDEYEAYGAWTGRRTAAKGEVERRSEPALEPPSLQQLAAFAAAMRPSAAEVRIDKCSGAGRVAIDCRDPLTYIRTDERGQPLWAPYLRGLEGGYVGVGADHGYNLIAEARSRWAWLVDDDPTVTALHRIIRAVVLASESPRDFVQAFAPERRSATRAVLIEALQPRGGRDKPAEPTTATILGVFDDLAHDLYRHFRGSLRQRPRFPDWGWLHVPEKYAYIRTLYQQCRISIVQTTAQGGLLDAAAVAGIADGARAVGVPIRVVYLSDLESRWKRLPQLLRINMAALPFDEKTVVLRAVAGRKWNRRRGFSKWHYVLHDGLHYQQLVRTRRLRVPDDLTKSRHALDDWLSWIGPPDERPMAVGSDPGQGDGSR